MDPKVKLMIVDPYSPKNRYTGIKFLSHKDACSFLWSDECTKFRYKICAPKGMINLPKFTLELA